ncbi:5-methylcytosine-specific restriction enzyme A [Chitinophaga sp. CF118]|uniref:HNH endonuclease n=1 Tax=Chitinophaga sp. CF118 TaxID=1884367 RepID=UPI0008ECB8EE|nr:HNH endonuclease [Chitinophaga sp. CF118]SFD20171.1 5-methylcytosine-specific restriction enzyme A [Chitinophaga sp. CF118]
MRNPKWHRDEIILALDLYFNPDRGSLDSNNPNIINLSRILNELPLFAHKPDEQRFRNPNGVTLKLCNFLPFDNDYNGKGMTRGSILDQELFIEFSNKRSELKIIATSIKAAISNIDVKTAISLVEDDDVTVLEGSILYKLHKVIERNSTIVKKKKERVIEIYGKLSCEICDFDFENFYGEIGNGFIECHHRTPLAQISVRAQTSLSDLALVCANCHRIIHRNLKTHHFEEIKALIQKRLC